MKLCVCEHPYTSQMQGHPPSQLTDMIYKQMRNNIHCGLSQVIKYDEINHKPYKWALRAPLFFRKYWFLVLLALPLWDFQK